MSVTVPVLDHMFESNKRRTRDFSHVTYGRTQQAELCFARCQKSRTQKIQKIQILIYNHLVVNLFNTFL